jgi:protocatechuate 3,4-dioxygenase beta subunit
VQSDDNLIVGGFVNTEDGEPVAGVDVQLLWDVMRGMSVLDGSETVTDPNGRWQCEITGESENISIRLKHPAYLAKYYNYRPSFEDLVDQTVVLVMNKGLQVSGFVHDTQGNPVPNALIMPPGSITGMSAEHGIQDSAKTVRTDTNGAFVLKAIGAGLQDIVVDAKGYAPTFVSVDITSEIPPIEVTLGRGENLTGVVVDKNGEPLSGVKVKIDDWNYKYKEGEDDYRRKQFDVLRRQAVTDAAGRYNIEHLPPVGDVEIVFVKRPGLLVSYIENDMAKNKTRNIAMYPIPIITGNVIDDDSGEAVTEFGVEASCRWDPNDAGHWRNNADKITSPEGNFSKTKRNFCAHDLPWPGWVAVKISAKGYHPAQSSWMRIDQEFSPVTIRLKKAQVLSSTLFGSDGKAVSNADVVVIEPSSFVYVRNGELDRGISNSYYRIIKTDGNGYFEFSVPSGPSKLLVVGYDEYLVADTNDLGDKVTLIPWAHVTGSVDTGNDINSNVTVQIVPEFGSNQQIRWMSKQTTNADGGFEFFYIPAIPQKIYYGPGSTNPLKKGPDINPSPNQELELFF